MHFQNAVVWKYDHNGSELWTRQFGPPAPATGSAGSYASGVAVEASGVYVAGATWVRLPPLENAPAFEDGPARKYDHTVSDYGFVRRYDADGSEVWTRQFGTPDLDLTQGVAAGASGVYVTGMTVKVPNEAGATEWDGFVRKYDRDGNEMWARQFGTPGWDDPRGVAIGASGVYVAGDTNGTFPGQSNAGEWDGFVRAYDHSGNELWTRQFGTVHRDHPLGVAVGVAGVYVAGVTWGTFPGETSASEGIRDGFLRIYDHDGNELATRQFGTPDPDVAQGVAVTPSGVYVAGRTDGTFPGETNAGGSDVFVAKFNVSVDLPLVERPRFVFSPFATAAILASSVVVVAVIVAIDRRKTKGRGRI